MYWRRHDRDRPDLFQRSEVFHVDALIAQPAVEALAVSLLVRLAGFDETKGGIASVCPLEHRLAAGLSALVRSDHLGRPPAQR